ncbi:hypothetical protein FGO68_gene6600 [Halteria grandinella]|uniref:Uncharacterized protein n=1 Tax=Halteria grandinella TaxID=5974 RepID=A0A8J8NLV8_HALGN|nr:hypothetical protein FGO68_gene6600 [Halteria grandinella]
MTRYLTQMQNSDKCHQYLLSQQFPQLYKQDKFDQIFMRFLSNLYITTFLQSVNYNYYFAKAVLDIRELLIYHSFI